MIRDEIVEEIHAVREAIAARFNNDLQAMCEDARRRQAAEGVKAVAYPPRRVDPPTTPTKKAS